VSVVLNELGLDYHGGYHIRELFDGHDYGVVAPTSKFSVDVNPSGCVMLRCDITKPENLNYVRRPLSQDEQYSSPPRRYNVKDYNSIYTNSLDKLNNRGPFHPGPVSRRRGP